MCIYIFFLYKLQIISILKEPRALAPDPNGWLTYIIAVLVRIRSNAEHTHGMACMTSVYTIMSIEGKAILNLVDHPDLIRKFAKQKFYCNEECQNGSLHVGTQAVVWC